MSNLIVFDLDGVITSEEAYWDAAGLTLHELSYSPRYWCLDKSLLGADRQYHPAQTAEESRRISRDIFPNEEILDLKARAINSNWDTCYTAVSLHLINVLAQLPNISSLFPLQPWDAEWLAAFREHIASEKEREESHPQGAQPPSYSSGDPCGRHVPPGSHALAENRALADSSFFDAPIFQEYVGLELINRLDTYASEVLGHPIHNVFSRYSRFWPFCQDIFQEWYLGETLYTETYGRPPAQAGKPGCIAFEHPLLPLEQVRTTLETLRQQGYVLGFATGRVYQEAVYPLKMYGLLQYFDEQHIATYDYVEQAEVELRKRGDQALLGKPHPFQFLVALDHSYATIETRDNNAQHEKFIVVGDSTSDILGGRAAGALTLAVLTGARTPKARQLLEYSKPDFTIEDMTKLPALLGYIDSLATIQRLQFTEREKAEKLLQRWFARHMKLPTESVTLTPKAVSLNSFNGFYRANGEEYFFKTHVEEQGVLEEYYLADLLHQAGYNIVKPLQVLHEEGRQMVIYPVVHWPVMFDLVRAIETGTAIDVTIETVVAAEKQECKRLLDIYARTLAQSTAEENARAPIHQLFWHRLTGGRFKSFYEGKIVALPHLKSHAIPFDELLRCRWTINKVRKHLTLGELIDRAMDVLNPARETATVIGHGDAHFGNVFLSDQKDYLYFDPAFAGRHSPLLDVVKPFYHNTSATWMYFPQEVSQELQLSVDRRGMDIYVEHNYALTPIRQAIYRTKMMHLHLPLWEMLRSHKALPSDWSEMQFLAMMCCPLLTVNLLDAKRFPGVISWLGLAEAVTLGNLALVKEQRMDG